MKNFYSEFFTFTNLRVILGGFGIQLILGYFYLWSPISVYITSFFHLKGQTISNELTNIIQPSLAYAKTFAMPFTFGYRNTTIFFGFILCLAYWHSSNCNNFWFFYIDYSIIGGMINGILLMLPIYEIQKHFTQNKGIATGIAFSGYGIGSIFWSQVSYHLINPNNMQVETDPITKKKFFPLDVCKNVPSAIKILGLIFFLGLTIFSIISFSQQKISPNEQQKKQTEKKQGKKYSQLLLTKQFLMIAFLAIFSSLFPMMIINNYKLIGLDLFNDDKFITMVVITAASIASGTARIIWGYFYDKTGFHISFVINLTLQSLIILVYILLPTSKLLFTIIVAVSFFCQAGTAILFPLFNLDLFGFEDGSKIYGFVHQAFSSANLFQYFIVYYFKDQYGFYALSYLFLSFNFIAFGIKTKYNLSQFKAKVE